MSEEVAVAEREAARAADPCLVIGEVASLLVDGDAVPAALQALVDGLHLRTAVLRSTSGTVFGAASQDSGAPVFEVPVHGRSGALLGTLTVSGATPADLPALRSAAAVLGLALAPPQQDDRDDAEDDLDDLADALHDGPVQALVAARYATDVAVRGGDSAMAREAVQTALVDVRRFLWHLRPRGSAGLVEALEQLSTQVVEAGGQPLVVLGDVEAAAALRGQGGVLAYRLVQAVVAAGGSAVRVALGVDGARLSVDVDGALPSFDRWRRRAQALGGELTTTPGRLRLVLPRPSDARTSP